MLYLCVTKFTPYIALSDYLPTIQSGQLNKQLLDGLQNGVNERRFVESFALNRIRGLIGYQYDLDFEFTPTLPFDYFKKYYANERVIIDYPEWVAETEYKQNDMVIHEFNGYFCLADNQDAEFDSDKWQGIGKQYDIYYIQLPYQRFELNVQRQVNAFVAGFYKVGERVWWNNHIYKCLVQTRTISQEELIQYQDLSDVGYMNVYPNDEELGKQYWEDEGEFVIEAGNFPSYPMEGQENPWTLGDNREPVVMQAVIDLALFQLHKRISPNNIPELRFASVNMTEKWLKNVKDGTESVGLYTLTPDEDDFMWGSNPKYINKW